MLTTVTGSLTIRSCRQLCQASAPTTLMPDATLRWRRRGTAAKAPSGIFSSGFMGTWIASGMSRSGHSSKLSFVGRISQQSRNTMEYSVLCCSRTPEDLEVSHGGKIVHHLIFEVLKAIKFGNAHGDVNARGLHRWATREGHWLSRKAPTVPCAICACWLSFTAPGKGTYLLSPIAHHLRVEFFRVLSIPAPGKC